MEHDNQLSVRDRFILTGKSLFARFGYEQTSTASIAREAGTSESQMVRHFTSKSGLLEAIFNDAWGRLNERINQIVAGAPQEREAIVRILRLVMDAFAHDQDLAFLFLFEGRRVRGQEIALSKGFLSFYELIHQLIRKGQAAGSFRKDITVDVMASALLGCAEGMMRDRLLAERTGQKIDAPPEHVETAFRAMIDALAP